MVKLTALKASLAAALLAGAALLAAPPAEARTFVAVGIGAPLWYDPYWYPPPPVVYAPPPVYYAPPWWCSSRRPPMSRRRRRLGTTATIPRAITRMSPIAAAAGGKCPRNHSSPPIKEPRSCRSSARKLPPLLP